MVAGRGVGDFAVPRKLVGFLSLLASALPVSLPGNTPVAAAATTAQAQDKRQTDDRADRVGAIDMLFGPPGAKDIRSGILGAGPRESRHCPAHLRNRYTRHPLGSLWPPPSSGRPELCEPSG